MRWMDDLRRLLGRARGLPHVPKEDAATCSEAVERVFEWLDGELDPDAERRIGRHLALCARCYPMVEFEKSFRAAVDRACRCQPLPGDVESGVLKALKAEGLDGR